MDSQLSNVKKEIPEPGTEMDAQHCNVETEIPEPLIKEPGTNSNTMFDSSYSILNMQIKSEPLSDNESCNSNIEPSEPVPYLSIKTEPQWESETDLSMDYVKSETMDMGVHVEQTSSEEPQMYMHFDITDRVSESSNNVSSESNYKTNIVKQTTPKDSQRESSTPQTGIIKNCGTEKQFVKMNMSLVPTPEKSTEMENNSIIHDDIDDIDDIDEIEALDRVSDAETVDTAKQSNYKCDTCNKIFKYRSSLTRHLNKHNPSRNLSCGLCHQYFSDENLKQKHNEKFHGDRLLCNECGTDFRSKSTLSIHMAGVHKKIGEGKKSYSCPFEGCGKLFTKRQLYQFHVNKHTGHKPFKCSNCDRHFINMYKKSQHEKICKNEKTIKCEICDVVFTDSASLKRHNNAIHRGLTHNCLCGKRYTQLSSLRRHQLLQKHENIY